MQSQKQKIKEHLLSGEERVRIEHRIGFVENVSQPFDIADICVLYFNVLMMFWSWNLHVVMIWSWDLYAEVF